MNLKDKLKILLNIHTRVVTGIFLLNCIYLFWLPGDASIRIIDILGIQIIGLISAVAFIPFLGEKEFSKVKMAVMNTLYFLVINISVLVIGYLLVWFSFEVKFSVIMMELMIILIYVITKVIFYLIDYSDAAKLNKKLQERNKDE